MVQYLMRKEKDFENLKVAIEKYNPIHFLVRPFSLGNKKLYIKEDLENKSLTFETKNGLTLLLNKKEILTLPLKDYCKGFSVEFQKENGKNAWDKYYHPMDPALPEPNSSVLRTVLDDLLLEIEFSKKIKLKEDGFFGVNINQCYWKII